MVNISEGRKGGGHFFLDAIERLNICDFIDKDKPLLTLLVKFFIFFINALSYNVLYFKQ